MTAPVTIESVNARSARISEIEEIIENKWPELDALKTEADRWQWKVDAVQRQLENITHRPTKAARGATLSAADKDQKEKYETDLSQAREELRAALNAYEPMHDELARLEAEKNDLERNPPVPSLSDLKAAHAEVMAVSVKIEQLQQSAEQAATQAPAPDTDAMATEIDSLLVERDLLAADIDIGIKPESELKKLNSRLTKARKELADVQEAADIGQAKQRGYQRRLDTLETDLSIVTAGYKLLLSFYARAEYHAELGRLNSLVDQLAESLGKMASCNALSLNSGDGLEFLSPSAQVQIIPEGISGITQRTIKPDSSSDRIQAQQLLDKITKQ
ncbi:chromosome segregation ATPase [Marinobacter sp. MBR-99]|jgi:chromosome segregation ATPase|uniref:hypothetical protein n=1 Tax=Marinobacter sp. MBR-99 TaxID=3156461 RepID=UPI003398DAD9